MPIGKKVYAADFNTVQVQGLAFSRSELTIALKDRVSSILWDESGRTQLKESLANLATTSFATNRLEKAINRIPSIKDWQVGEALAEAYLVDHRNCEFPWYSARDLRNPEASPAGADLVGFQQDKDAVRFAFGEVKTSTEEKWPPQVVNGRHGLAKQLEDLRDSEEIKGHLVILYLGHRASNTSWYSKYRLATARYLKNPADVSLFGFLIRDVNPHQNDLKNRATCLANKCPSETSIELRALYLPTQSIAKLAGQVTKIKNTKR